MKIFKSNSSSKILHVLKTFFHWKQHSQCKLHKFFTGRVISRVICIVIYCLFLLFIFLLGHN